MNKKITFEPIGYVHCEQQYRSEAPRQAIFAANEGVIRLQKGHNYEQAVADLEGFSRIWVIFCFHLNKNWKPYVHPPIVDRKKKISVFATRSPHRPNQIGMSCIELVKIDGLELHIRNFDMLNNSPVLDIKPYIPHADSFPEAQTGWLEKAQADMYHLDFSEQATNQMTWLHQQSGLDLIGFCKVQLGHNPLNSERKRLQNLGNGKYIIFCRTWQIHFGIDEKKRSILINEIKSNYNAEELKKGSEDKYSDKDFHRNFLDTFNN